MYQSFQPYQAFPSFPQSYQQAAQSFQQPQFSGRFVSPQETINPAEVPMGSPLTLFPVNDGSAIIAKKWSADGNIITVRYIPETQEARPDPVQAISAKLDKVLEMIGGSDE